MQKITTFLTFDHQAEEAARFYTEVFGGKITEVNKLNDRVLTVTFEVAGTTYVALNAGAKLPFGEGVSLSIACETQDEIDRLWDKLSAGGEPGPCGWLKDRYGVSWQVVPAIIPQLIGGKDRARAQRVMDAVMKMKKLDIRTLKQAAESA
jgi:predicted 3-demethylubiquinone-9 3-methyltransferase (glyoxalase superfamily)